MHKTTQYILLFLIVICSLYNNAQTVQNKGLIPVTPYGSEDYNMNNQFWDVTQGQNGYLYFGNTEGLVIYNGKDWTPIKGNYDQTVRSVIEFQGSIYLGLDNMIGKLILNNDNSYSIKSLNHLLPKDVKFEDVWNCVKFQDKIAFRTLNYIFIFDGEKFETYQPRNVFRRFFALKDGVIGYDLNEGFFTIKDTITYHKKLDNLTDGMMSAFVKYDEDYFLLFYRSGKVFKINYQTLDYEPFSINFSQAIVDYGIYPTTPLNYKNKYYVLGTFKNGVIIFDKNGNAINHINAEKGLASNTVTGTFIDQDHNLWATNSSGVNLIDLFSPYTILNDQLGLEDGLAISATILNNKLYALTREGTYTIPWADYENPFEFNTLKHIGKEYESSENETSTFSVIKINSEAFISSEAGILVVNDEKKYRIQKDFFYYFLLPYGNDKIFAAHAQGYHIISKKNEKWKLEKSFKTDHVDPYLVLINGNIWGYYQNRIFRSKINLKSDSITIDKTYGTENGIPEGMLSFVQNSLNQIIISTPKGYCHYDSVKDSFHIQQDLIHPEDQLYFLSTDSVSKISFGYSNKKEWRLFHTKTDEVQLSFSQIKNKTLNKLNHTTGFLNFNSVNENNIFIAKDKELIRYDYKNDTLLASKYSTLLTKVKLLKNDSILSKGIYYNQDSILKTVQNTTVNIPFNANQLVFNYSSTSNRGIQPNQFSYLLEGFNNNWSAWSTTNFKEFTNLSEGTYTFKVKGKNGIGEIGQEASYTFIILPPWYRTYSAYLGYILLAIISMYGIVKWNTRRLVKEKEELEEIVLERTQEIREKSAEIEQQAEEILAQNDQLVTANDELAEKDEKITASITYARRIQGAMLTAQESIDEMFEEHFLLYLPRDIVSGDFYWAYTTPSDKLIWIAADCTGHSVPGAMMSMIGISLLNEIVIEKGIEQPDLILNELRTLLLSALERGGSDNAKEGMDISVCTLDKEKMELKFAGAFNPLYLFRDGELMETPGDNMPIGEYKLKGPFTLHTIPVQKGDSIYLFSDGYVDQMGGPKGKKFMFKRYRQKFTDIQELSLNEQKESLKATFDKWKGDVNQMDDVVIFGVKI